MGKCIHCGRPAGWFRTRHAECDMEHRTAKRELPSFIAESITKGREVGAVEPELQHMSEVGFLKPALREQLIQSGIQLAVDHALDDDELTEAEEERISKWVNELAQQHPALKSSEGVVRLVRASIVRNLREGKPVTGRVSSDGLPFLFQKSEELIWAFNHVDFYQNTTRTEYIGGSQGVSIRLTKGVYYRTGSFRGRPVKVDELKHQGTGMLAITTKHLYFWSPNKAFKVPFAKLISMETFEDGIRIQRDGTTTKPQIFKGIDGWFAANLISNLHQQ
jgi:hypothetical protein